MKKRFQFSRILAVLALIVFVAPPTRAFGQEININVDYTPGREKPIPLSISGFKGEAEEVIKFDLTVQGFTFTASEEPQYLLSGSAEGNLVGRAQDRINRTYVVNKSYSGGSTRKQAHAFVDDFLAALGRKGIGSTKIAFKKSSPPATSPRRGASARARTISTSHSKT